MSDNPKPPSTLEFVLEDGTQVIGDDYVRAGDRVDIREDFDDPDSAVYATVQVFFRDGQWVGV